MIRLSFMVTDKCNIACQFCAPGCSPQCSHHLSRKEMKATFDEIIAQHEIPLVVFTGGEPMLYEKDVCDVMQHIHQKSEQTKIRIVTNGSWATTETQAYQTLECLKNNGLSEINYSVDDFHQAFIPIRKIKFAVEATLAHRIPVLLAHKTYPGSKTNKLYYEKILKRKIFSLDQLKLEDFYAGDRVMISSACTLPLGRGAEQVNQADWLPERYLPDAKKVKQDYKKPCGEVLKSCNISADGYLVPCCGLYSRALRVFYFQKIVEGHVLDVLEQSSEAILYNWLALEGPWAIREFIRSQDDSIDFSEEYVQTCQICQELFSRERVLQIIHANLEAIGHRLTPLRCLFDANRAQVVEKVLSQCRTC